MAIPSWILFAGSTLAVLLIAFGLFQRKRNRALHWKCMVAAFVVDIGLVLIIELSRSAVNTATTTTDPLMLFHIAVSVGVVLGYLTMFYLGRRLLHGDEKVRRAHLYVGIGFVALRLLNYVTSFMVG